jgi:hypothetical protein
MSSKLCVPTTTENLLRLSPLYHDYFGEQQAAFTKMLDGFADAGCYVPRFYHAPDSGSQLAGVPANGYKTYLMALPVGSFILGFLHTTSSAPGSAGSTPPSIQVPPNASGFTCQITDLAIDHKLFSHPTPEAWFINDNLLGASSGAPPYPGNTLGFTFPSFVRLLPAPYPVVPPGQFQVEFWNSLDVVNTDVQMTFLVLVPDAGNVNAGRVSSK